MAIRKSDDIVGDVKKIMKTIERRQRIASLVPLFLTVLLAGSVVIFFTSGGRHAEQVAEQPVEAQSYASESGSEDFESMRDAAVHMERFAADSAYYSELAYTVQFLSDEELAVYDAVYRCLTSAAPQCTVPTKDPEVLKKAISCVLIDHPEVFFMKDYKFSKYTQDGEIKRLTFTPVYELEPEEIEERWEKISAVADAIVQRVPTEASDYDKVASLYNLIIESTEYDTEAEDNQNISSVFIGGASVCQGYSKALQLLLLRLKMPATLVTGKIIGGDLHAWNAVQIDGDWCYVDVTWGDASYVFHKGDLATERVSETNYDYLLVPFDDISSTHRADSPVELPECTTAAHSYYAREGFYLESFSKEALDSVFSNQRGLEYVTVKCADDSTYSQAVEYLINDYGVLGYLKEDGLSYSLSDAMRKITFRSAP